MIPTNAKKIIDLRKNGYKPDEMILVSIVGKVDEMNHVVYASPKDDYEWGWCAGLDVCVFANSAVEWRKTVDSISKAKPRFLALWDVDRKEGAEFYRTLNLSASEANLRHSETKLSYITWCSIANKIFSGEICN